MYKLLAIIILLLVLILSSCTTANQPPSPSLSPSPSPAQILTPSKTLSPSPASAQDRLKAQESEPTPTPTPVLPSPAPETSLNPTPTPHPTPTLEPEITPKPVNITIDYIGVENAYGGNVQLVVVASDGYSIEKYSIPRDDEYYDMDNFEVKTIGRRVFHSADLKGNLKLNILAYHRDQQKKTNLELINMMEWYYGDSINMLKNLVLNMPENDKLIGEYEHTWYSDEDIGIRQYHETADNLHIWFSVWSDTEPQPSPEPKLIPDVKIISVDLPENAKKRGQYETFVYKTYYNTLRLENNEAIDLKIDWQAHSSVTGDFAGGSVIVPSRSSIEVSRDYYYETAGKREITYRIFYRGVELDSWSGSMTVLP